MVDNDPLVKHDEQYPLLKVDGGGGDGGGHPQNPSTLVSPGWGVTCTPKQSWFSRWPEFFSACWMTIILLGISFVVFYALGISAYRRQPIIVIKCNTSKPASDVYYYQILQRGAYVPFVLYSEYLSNMAIQYPSLKFNVIFLIDDSIQTAIRAPRHSRFINRLIPYHPILSYNTRLEENNKRELRDFQMKYQNVNITITPLSNFMATTPLKYRWRAIPSSYLPFYARIFSVWQNGGVGMDLTTFNNRFNNHENKDRRIAAILRQHNDGIKPDNYANTLNTIYRDEDNELFTIFFGFVHQLLNETRLFFNKTFSLTHTTTEKMPPKDASLIRVHRDKRELYGMVNSTNFGDKINSNSTVYVQFINDTEEKITNQDLKKNEYHTPSDSVPDAEKLTNTELIIPIKMNTTNGTEYESATAKKAISNSGIKPDAIIANNSDGPQMILFYDFSIFSDGLRPIYLLPETLSSDYGEVVKGHEKIKSTKRSKSASHLLSIDSDGTFIAASSRLHPFLGHLLSSGCQRMHPKFAIQDTLLTQCGGMFRDDVYCSNIYLL